jgi:hypothetical protein
MSSLFMSFREEIIVNKMLPHSSLNVFEMMTQKNIDWCRYCGTTESVSWELGPWGPRTLCSQHEYDDKERYEILGKTIRLDRNLWESEMFSNRTRPIIQEFCVICGRQEPDSQGILYMCFGCPRAYHKMCYPKDLGSMGEKNSPWFCSAVCQDFVHRDMLISHQSLQSKLLSKKISIERQKSGRTTKSKKDDNFPAEMEFSRMVVESNEQSMRKKRKLDLLCDHSLMSTCKSCVKDNLLPISTIPVPTWRLIDRPSIHCDDTTCIEEEWCSTDEATCMLRHTSYELLEKEHRSEVLRRSSQYFGSLKLTVLP